MKALYGLMSDLHCHNWSAFSTLDAEGRNSRLIGTLAEIDACVKNAMAAGTMRILGAGDWFHTRGTVDPSVFNPVKERLEYWQKEGVMFVSIAGNHDLGSRESGELHSSVAMLSSGRFFTHHKTAYYMGTVLVPWHSKPTNYLAEIERVANEIAGKGEDLSKWDLICHIGIDGTLTEMPDHGVNAKRLENFGFKRVFSGHYHHHRNFGGGVYSIGALTQQTWGDIGTRAGHLIVYEDEVKFFASNQPSFIDLSSAKDEDEAMAICDGNYVRSNIGNASPKERDEAEKAIKALNAKGVLISFTPTTTEVRRVGASVKKLTSIRKSVSDYCDENKLSAGVKSLCENILTEHGL